MKKLMLGSLASALFVSSVAYASFGGWAVVKVAKIPDAWVAGKPLQLSWQVLQHGVTPLTGLTPTLEARSGQQVVHGTARENDVMGRSGYTGTIVFPTTGDWQVTVNSGFGNSRAVLIPWRVVDSLTPIRGTVTEHLEARGLIPLGDVERGRRLFASQGCITCHVHRDVPIVGQLSTYGPELSDRRFPADYLAKFLADPSIKPPTDGKRMPNLAMREKEIIPLVAFINAERKTAAK